MKIKNSFRGGRVNIPSSKSYHHRYLIANALSILQHWSMCEEQLKENQIKEEKVKETQIKETQTKEGQTKEAQRGVQSRNECFAKLQNTIIGTDQEAIQCSSKQQDNKEYIEIKSIGICDDVLATIEAIRNLGIEVEINKEQSFASENRKEIFEYGKKEQISKDIIRLATKLPIVKRQLKQIKDNKIVQNSINSQVCSSLHSDSGYQQNSEISDSFLVFKELPNERIGNHLLNSDNIDSFFKDSSTTYHINVQESGSTLRFLIPICLALNIDVCIDGKGTLIKRPLTDYIQLFVEKKINYSYDGTLPIYLEANQANKLTGELKVSTEISSQFLSGLLFACPLLHEDSSIIVGSKLKSEDYINMTLDVLKTSGICIDMEQSSTGRIYKIKKNQSYEAEDVFVEGDYSCAAFLMAAGILSKEVQIGNLNPHSLQGDKKLIPLLQSAGADIQFIDDLLYIRPSELNAMEIDAQGIIDSVPILCVLFSTAKGRTKIYNVKRLKAKESDRIKSSIDMISSLGGKAHYDEEEDCIILDGVKQLQGGFVHSYSDHRIAMSAAIAALICREEVEIDDHQCVSKSYTDFFHDFKKLGGEYVI